MKEKFIINSRIWLGVGAALVYSSWPLGYLLNPNVAHRALASQLETANQPYNWLFIGLDVLSGGILLIVGVLQQKKSINLLTRFSIASYMIFGALVIVAALVPFNCNSMITSCSDAVHSPLLLFHGAASIVSPVALLVSLVLLIKSTLSHHPMHWSRFACTVVMVCWGLTGVFALKRYHHSNEYIVQYVFITICSLSVILSVILIEYLLTLHNQEGYERSLK